MKRRNKKISIISRESDSKTLDVAMLEAELLKRGDDVTVLSRLLTKERSVKALGYIGHVIRQEAAILASDVVVLDTYCIPASMFPHRKRTKVVQMWHALGAVKKFGWQAVGKQGGSSERTARLMKMHHGYDRVICASDVTAGYFREAFRVSRDRLVKCGLPRIDYIKSVAAGDRHDETASKILAKYPQLKSGKQIVLYAPTFRRGKSVDVQSIVDALDFDSFELAVKLHPLYRADMSAAEAPDPESRSAKVIYDEDFSSFDWLSVADIIISDYSSLVIESTLADKPLYVYAYDLEEYESGTGLNMDFKSEAIAPYVFKDARELADAIKNGDYDIRKLREFRDKYIEIETENCTAALADYIESL